MYRNIVYKIDQDWNGSIVLFTWDEDGNPVTRTFPHKSHLYYENEKGSEKSIFGTNLVKKSFTNIANRKKWLKENEGVRLFENLPPTREFLIEYFGGMQESPDFQKYPLRTQVIDIEIAVEDEFPLPDEAKYPINVMTIYDYFLKEYHCWVLSSEAFRDKDNIIFHVCENELSLLKNFMLWYRKNIPDVITGWNIETFDIPYLVNRLKKLLPEAYMYLSPVEEVRQIMREQKNKQTPTMTYKIEGVSCLDYLNMYKYKFNREPLPKYSLEEVAQYELGYGKLEIEGSMKQFYKNNFRKFVEYNIHDVRLVYEIDMKLQFIELARKICNIGLCEYESIYKSSPYIFGAIALQARSKNMKIYSGKYGEDIEDNSFSGGYVFEPRVGIYRRGVSSLDFNSLYPNIMICLNISPETKIGKIIENANNEKITVKFENSQVKDFDRVAFERDVLGKKLVKSSNNILYLCPDVKKGILPEFLDRMYSERKKIKSKLSKLENEKEGKTGEELKKLETDIKRLDNHQNAIKLFINSVYGQLGSKYFPLYDLDNAEAVTTSGRFVIKKAAEFIDQYFKDKYGQDIGMISGDTDSCYFNCEKVAEKLIGDEPFTKANVKKICHKLEDFLADINNYCFQVTSDYFRSSLRKIEFKRETFCSEGAFLAKKHYVLHILDKEGVAVDKFKYIGVEVKKTEHPIFTKNILKTVIESSMKCNWTRAEYNKFIEESWLSFCKSPPEELAFYKGYNKEKDAMDFLIASKGSGIHARAAIYFNQLIDKLKLKDKYEEVRLGDRIRYIYINPNNSFGLDVIGWKDQMPAEFGELFQINHRIMFEKMILKPLKRFEELNGWGSVNPADGELQSVLEL